MENTNTATRGGATLGDHKASACEQAVTATDNLGAQLIDLEHRLGSMLADFMHPEGAANDVKEVGLRAPLRPYPPFFSNLRDSILNANAALERINAQLDRIEL